MEAVLTRVRLRVAPDAARPVVVSGQSARDRIVGPAGIGPEDIERRLSSAAGKERRA